MIAKHKVLNETTLTDFQGIGSSTADKGVNRCLSGSIHDEHVVSIRSIKMVGCIRTGGVREDVFSASSDDGDQTAAVRVDPQLHRS